VGHEASSRRQGDHPSEALQEIRWESTQSATSTGPVTNELAAKGILVSTGKYTAASYEFCENKPLQLVNGNELLYLLEGQGVKAKIVFPRSWKDPVTTRDN
jgi:restriction system protein